MNKKIKQMVIFMCMVISFAMSACSQKMPTEIRTYRELLNYSLSAMQTYKDRPAEYTSLIKDAITILGKDLDKDVSSEVWTNFSDKNEIESAVFIVYFTIGSIKNSGFNEKYKSVDGNSFSSALKEAFLYKAGGNKLLQTVRLFEALEKKDLEGVMSSLNSGADINAKSGKNGDTPLIYAVKKGNVHIIEFLLKAKPDLNAADNSGKRVIHYAASDSFSIIWELIANSGADVNVKDSEGRTPLMCVRQDAIDRAEMLIQMWADINAKRNNGNTMLIDVCSNSNFKAEWISFLIKSGADINAKSNNGLTALETAQDWYQSWPSENCKRKIALLKAAGAR